MTSPVPGKTRPFHGWKVLGLCTFCQFVSMGFSMYLIGLFIEPLSVAFDTTPGRIGSASALFVVAGAILGPVLGYWSDKGRARHIMLFGALAMACGFALLSQTDKLVLAALICVALLAPGAAMLGSIPTTVMVVQWFEKRRGLAIGITAAGISTGGFVMPPVAAWLLENFGWRGSVLVLGLAIALVLVPAVWRLAIARPADIGQYPDGADSPPATQAHTSPDNALKLTAIITRRDFWFITLSVGVLSFFGILIITYLTPYAKESGMSLRDAALMLSLYSISGIAGKFTCGWLCDHFPARWMLSGTLAMASVGWLPILFFNSTPAFLVTAVSVGFAMGALIPVWSTLVAMNFGLQNFGRVRGVMSLALVGVTVIPGPLGGYLYDSTQTYATAFSALWWILPAGVLGSLFTGQPKAQAPAQ